MVSPQMPWSGTAYCSLRFTFSIQVSFCSMMSFS